MAIPLAYNLRNLRLRWGATVMTAIGVALTVAVAVFILALLSGLNQAFAASGDPLNVLVMRKGTQSEVESSLSQPQFAVLRLLPGVAQDASGQPLVSPELVVAVVLPRANGAGEVNVTVRGLTLEGLRLHPKVHIVAGRRFQPGHREVVVSNAIARSFRGAQLGDSLRFGRGEWRIVGIFDSGGSAAASEIWGDVNQMSGDFGRPGFSSVLLHATDPVAAQALVHRVSDDQRLELQGLLETDYYAQQTSSGAPIKYIGIFIAVIMAIGSCFAAMNTMYAAVAYRAREIATLRILGFARASILASFVLESLLLAVIGWAVGLLAMLPLDGVTTTTNNGVTFSEAVFQLRVTPEVAAIALAFAVIMGLIGGLAPAWHAARGQIVTALRA
ncbi:MAG TPA: ABC transporter permease [Terriglobales bacterium]|nr:ABC transporter permease [Terriglobales bacterium]